MSSWFVAVTQFRDRMVELNQQITWVPAHISDGQFGKWLEGARDWSISRNRFWGSPIPVWVSDDPAYPRVDVYGSLDELERDFGVRPTDLHRPYVDELTRPNPDDPTGRSTMRRVPEVLDCWFESGSMPFAQVHYPFENSAARGARRRAGWFEHHYPGDFIVEYNGQTRGWFYTLHVLATALFDRPAFVTCMAHGIVLGDDGQKMSQVPSQLPDVGQVFERDGSDAMRWFLMSSPILRGADLVVTEAGHPRGRAAGGAAAVERLVLPRALCEGIEPGRAPADRVSRRAGPVRPVEDGRAGRGRHRRSSTSTTWPGACGSVRQFLEVLTNWYVRRSRQRFWDGDADAIDTLHTVLETVCRVGAPLLPLTTEAIWRGLTGGRSVHLADWPARQGDGALPFDAELVAAMDEVREVASVALSVRKAAKLRVRQPLASLTVAVPDPDGAAAVLGAARGRGQRARGAHDRAGGGRRPGVPPADRQRAGGRPAARAGRAAGDQGVQGGRLVGRRRRRPWSAAASPCEPGEYTLELVATGSASDAVGVLRSGGFVSLDTALDDDLVADGLVRDVVRGVQDVRRAMDLDVSDRIELTVGSDDDVAHAALVGAAALPGRAGARGRRSARAPERRAVADQRRKPRFRRTVRGHRRGRAGSGRRAPPPLAALHLTRARIIFCRRGRKCRLLSHQSQNRHLRPRDRGCGRCDHCREEVDVARLPDRSTAGARRGP